MKTKEEEILKNINNLKKSISEKQKDIEELEVTPNMKQRREKIKVLIENKKIQKKEARKDPNFMPTNEIILSLGVALMITSLVVVVQKNPILYVAIVAPTIIGAIKFHKNISWILKYFVTDIKINRLSVIDKIHTKVRKKITKRITKPHYKELYRHEKNREIYMNELLELRENKMQIYEKDKKQVEETTTLEKTIKLIDSIPLDKSFKRNIEAINNVSLMLNSYIKTLDIPVQLELTERIAYHYENAIKLAIDNGDLDKATLKTIDHSYITNILLNNGLSVKDIKKSKNITDSLINILQTKPIQLMIKRKQR